VESTGGVLTGGVEFTGGLFTGGVLTGLFGVFAPPPELGAGAPTASGFAGVELFGGGLEGVTVLGGVEVLGVEVFGAEVEFVGVEGFGVALFDGGVEFVGVEGFGVVLELLFGVEFEGVLLVPSLPPSELSGAFTPPLGASD
jgi:hypothetical protein